jgi:hypothetical protein
MQNSDTSILAYYLQPTKTRGNQVSTDNNKTLPLNLWTSSSPLTTRILESADVIRTSEELPGANC